MAEYEEMVRLVDGAYKNILEKFNPCARQLIAAGKTYLKALHAAVAASKGYMDAISRLARHAHQATWGGCTDIGTALMQLVDVQKEIENQQMNVLKAFYVDVIVPLESNIEKDAKVVASEQKRFMQQQKTHHESYLKIASIVKKQRKKSRAGNRGSNVDKEIKQMQSLEEEKGKLDGFCESSLKQAITQERRRFGFVLERQCSLAKHYMAYTAKGHALLQQNVEGWLDIVRTRETLPESISKIFNTVPELRLPVRCSSEYACSGILSDPECSYGGSLSRRLPRSTDNSCVDLRSLIADPYGLPPRSSMARAKSDFNLASSTASLDSAEYVSPSRGGGSPLAGGMALGVTAGDRPRVRALYAYLSSGEHQLSFHEGDVIALVGGRNKGWQYGVNLRNNRCGWFPIAYTEPHDPGDASDFDSFISGSDSSAAVPSSSSESSGGSSGLGRWRPRSTYFASDFMLPPGPAPRRPLSSFADAPSFPLRLDPGGEDVANEPHHRGVQPNLLPASGSPGRGRGREAGSSSSGVSSAASSATGIPSGGCSSSCGATPSSTSATAPATIHPVYGRHTPVAGCGTLRPPRRSMTSPCPFPLLPPPRLPPPGSLLHGSSDSGFGNEATAASATAPAASSTAGSAAGGTTSTTVPASPDVKATATLTRQDSVREEDEEQEEQPRDNVFSSVKLKKVLTDDRSAPMIT
ncbi:BAR/IMD domain-containing adapter protein 2 isoform X1 [Dermacentor andersoni]|uniref:BAR/IMD domain-containing adapter protein 2 isoform X1 n=1 Tax=Dermacentor andersoni TaxID=34620 RepID=UPI002155CDBE|nr:brain-specific angiogenesis inhibitor 1-associated protein 2-like isoform X1 [Dermacentor andersoni]